MSLVCLFVHDKYKTIFYNTKQIIKKNKKIYRIEYFPTFGLLLTIVTA